MGYPTKEEIRTLFANLEHYPEGHKKFFDTAIEESTWTLTGDHFFSGTWHSREAFLKNVWHANAKMIASPGPSFILPDGLDSIISDSEGRAAVEMISVNTTTLQTGLEYRQNYSWHCRFNNEGKIVHVKMFPDSKHAVDIIGEERKAQHVIACHN